MVIELERGAEIRFHLKGYKGWVLWSAFTNAIKPAFGFMGIKVEVTSDYWKSGRPK